MVSPSCLFEFKLAIKVIRNSRTCRLFCLNYWSTHHLKFHSCFYAYLTPTLSTVHTPFENLPQHKFDIVCTGYSFWDRLCNFLHKSTWLVLSVHNLNKLGKFWQIYEQLLNIVSSYGWYEESLWRFYNHQPVHTFLNSFKEGSTRFSMHQFTKHSSVKTLYVFSYKVNMIGI